MDRRVGFQGNLSTTAMGILPHHNLNDALRLALSVDIPFWPQLPKLSFHEDMYVQAMEYFPGVVIDEDRLYVYIDTNRFLKEITQYLELENDPSAFVLSEKFSPVYQRFLSLDLASYIAVRGQIISPVSLTLKIVDENGKPIVYNDEMRAFVYAFIQKKLNAQYAQLRLRNANAFVWIDDPGLEFVFNAMCGYNNVKAKEELTDFFDSVDGPRGVHLCGRPDWDFLLSLNVEILSFNAYAFGDIFVTYDRVKGFLEKGNIISWGIVPTYFEEFLNEDTLTLAGKLESMWTTLERKGVDRELILQNSLLAPATCNLMNPDKTSTVEKSFELLTSVSRHLKEKYL